MIAFATTVAGIPCRVEETDEAARGWQITDRRGYPAEWLERKLTGADENAIERRLERERIDWRMP